MAKFKWKNAKQVNVSKYDLRNQHKPFMSQMLNELKIRLLEKIMKKLRCWKNQPQKQQVKIIDEESCATCPSQDQRALPQL